jgi:hypothetical protein
MLPIDTTCVDCSSGKMCSNHDIVTDTYQYPLCDVTYDGAGYIHIDLMCYTPMDLYKSTTINIEYRYINTTFCIPQPPEYFSLAQYGILSLGTGLYKGNCQDGLLCYQGGQLFNKDKDNYDALCMVKYTSTTPPP